MNILYRVLGSPRQHPPRRRREPIVVETVDSDSETEEAGHSIPKSPLPPGVLMVPVMVPTEDDDDDDDDDNDDEETEEGDEEINDESKDDELHVTGLGIGTVGAEQDEEQDQGEAENVLFELRLREAELLELIAENQNRQRVRTKRIAEVEARPHFQFWTDLKREIAQLNHQLNGLVWEHGRLQVELADTRAALAERDD